MRRPLLRNRQMQLILPVIGVLIVVVIALILFGDRLGFLGGTALRLPDPPFPVIPAQVAGADEQQLQRDVAWRPLQPGTYADCARWLSFHSNADGRWDLYRVSLNDATTGTTGLPFNMTRGTGTASSITPSTSPNGLYVAFATDRDSNWEVYVMDADGSNPQRVTWNTSAIDKAPAWSADGRYIVYETTRHGNWDLYRVDVTTGDETRLTTAPTNETDPVFTPDGKALVYVSDSDGIPQLNALDLETRKVTLLSDSLGDDSGPVVSPDGANILFTSVRESGSTRLYRMKRDGSGVTALSADGVEAYNPVWSRQNGMIAYEAHRTDQSMIMLAQVDSQANPTKTRQLTADADKSYAPMWVCEGSALAFTSDISGNSDIYLTTVSTDMNAAPLDIRRDAQALTATVASDRYPFSAPNQENASRRAALPASSAAISTLPTTVP